MTDTSTNLPVCVHCGTMRPADETTCPNCGKPWIDVSIQTSVAGSTSDPTPAVSGAAAVAASAAVSEATSEPPSKATSEEVSDEPADDATEELTEEIEASEEPDQGQPPADATIAAAVAATSSSEMGTGSDNTGEFGFDDWTLPPEPRRNRAKWLIPIVLLIAVGALWSVVFLKGGSNDSPPVAIATTTTLPPVTTTTLVAAAATATTLPPTTTTSTTQPPPAFPAADEWTASGDPIATADIKLKASGIGTINLGTTITDSTGALVASLGPADEAGLESNTCKGEERYWLRWGSLTAYFDGFTDESVFVAYRNSAKSSSGPELETLSGLAVGDTVEKLKATYSFYTVSFEVMEGQNLFRLLEGADLLLWGPISDTDPTGTVDGIYSPDSCSPSDG